MKHITNNPLLIASLILMAGPAHAAVIYNHDFGGVATTDLHGISTDTGAGTWNSSTDWKADGSISGSSSAGDDDSAFLSFAPVGGNVYTLSATFTLPTLGESTSAWVGLGFTASDVTGSHTSGAGFWPTPNDPTAWMLYRRNQEVRSFVGVGTANSADEGDYSGMATMSVDLDTTGAQWTAEWYVDGTSVRTHTFTTNPTINHVGFTRENGASSTISNFNLSVEPVPEPSSALLLGLSGLSLLLRRCQ